MSHADRKDDNTSHGATSTDAGDSADEAASDEVVDPLVGQVVDGRYEVMGVGGHGGMATVYRAVHVGLHHHVALKVLYLRAPNAKLRRSRFVREARTLAALRHPSIVPVHDFGSWQQQPFLVMPWIDGGSLDGWVSSVKPGPVERLQALLELLGALSAAHGAGVIHRDVKPSNVLIDDTPSTGRRAMLADFGLARTVESEGELTEDGRAMGTPLYMAPEQVDHYEAIGPAADVYAVGAVAYALFAGRPPHRGKSIHEIFTNKLREDPAPLEHTNRYEVAPAVESVIMKSLERSASARFANAAEFSAALAAAAGIGVGGTGAWTGAAHAVRPSSGAARSDVAVYAYPIGADDQPPPGRHQDADKLWTRAEAAMAGRGSVILLRGGAGVGKSDLCRWLVRRLDGRPAGRSAVVRCASNAPPLQPIRDALSLLVAADSTTDRTVVDPHIREPGLDSLTGDEGSEELAAWLVSEAHLQPTTVIVEDAHQLDPESAAVFERIAEQLVDTPTALLIVLVARTGGADEPEAGLRTVLVHVGDTIEELSLEPLDRDQMDQWLDVRWPGVSTKQREAAWRGSSGNPLHADALLRHWERHPEDVLRQKTDEIEVATLVRTLEANLDDLEEELAAALRKPFRDMLDALAVLSIGPMPGDLVDRYLDDIGFSPGVRDELIDFVISEDVVTDLDPGPAEELVFTHEPLRRALYDEQERRPRRCRRWHRSAAEAREAFARADEGDHRSAIAEHWWMAGEAVRGATMRLDDAELALAQGSSARALALTKDARRWLADSREPDAERLLTQSWRCEALAARSVEDAGATATAACIALERLDVSDSVQLTDVVAAAAWAAAAGEDTALESIGDAVDRVVASGDEPLAGRLCYTTGGSMLGMSDGEAAKLWLSRAATLAGAGVGAGASGLDPYTLYALLHAQLGGVEEG